MKQIVFASLATCALVCSSQASATSPEYPTDPRSYKVQTFGGWIVCEVSHYAPQASGDPHAGEVVREFWNEPFQWEKPLKLQYARYSSDLMLTGDLYEEYARSIASRYGLSFEYFQQGYCTTHSTRENAANAIERGRHDAGGRTFIVVPPPTEEMLARASRAVALELGQKEEDSDAVPETIAGTASTDGDMKASSAAEKGKGPPVKSAAQIAAEERAARAAEREAEFQRQQAEYERQLAAQQAKVQEYQQAQADVAKRKAELQAETEAAAAAYRKQQEAYAETLRLNDEAQARYQAELAATKVRADFDERNKLHQASTDTDANRCVTSAETQLNASFKGNTAATVTNGCGQPVDVRICLMTSKGWNCGVRTGVQSQSTASFSSFDATGQIFVDARMSSSSKPLASPD